MASPSRGTAERTYKGAHGAERDLIARLWNFMFSMPLGNYWVGPKCRDHSPSRGLRSLETYIRGYLSLRSSLRESPPEGRSRDGNWRNFLVRPPFEELLGALEKSQRGLHGYGIELDLWSRWDSLNSRGQFSCPSIEPTGETSLNANEHY